jgi:hypothetical protein
LFSEPAAVQLSEAVALVAIFGTAA